MHWRLFSSIDPYTVVSNQFRLQLLTVKLLLNDVLHVLCDLCGESTERFGEPNSSPRVMSGAFFVLSTWVLCFARASTPPVVWFMMILSCEHYHTLQTMHLPPGLFTLTIPEQQYRKQNKKKTAGTSHNKVF